MATPRSPWSDRKARGPAPERRPASAPMPSSPASPAPLDAAAPAPLDAAAPVVAPSEGAPSTPSSAVAPRVLPMRPQRPIAAKASKPASPPREPLWPRIRARLAPAAARVRSRAAAIRASGASASAAAASRARSVASSARERSRLVAERVREWLARPAKAAPRLRVPASVDTALVALVAFLALTVKLGALGLSATPETSAVYLAGRLAEGADAYAGFPSSRPPGHLWLLAALAKTGLGGWAAAQWAALVAFVLAVGFVRAAARPFGRMAAVLASLAMLLGYEPLILAARPAGETFALAFVAAAAFALSRARGLWAGALLAIAVSCALPAAIPAIVALALFALVERRTALRALASFVVSILVLAGLAVALHGAGALEQPVRLAIALATKAGGFIRVQPLLAFSAGWLALALLGPLLAPRDGRRLALAFAAAGLAPIALIALSPVFEREAIVPAWPLVALAGALSAQGLADRYRAWSLDGAACWPGRAAIAVAIALVALGEHAERLGGLPSDPVPMHAHTAPANAPGAFARTLLWRDSYAPGERPTVLRRVLWRDSTRANSLEQLSQVVRSQSKDGDLLVGDAAFTPALALVSGRRIALDLADPALARAAPAELAVLVAKVEQLKPRFVVTPTRGGLASTPPFASWSRREYLQIGNFADDAAGWVYVSARRP